MTRARALELARKAFDDGSLQAFLDRGVAYPTESQEVARAPVLAAYLEEHLAPRLRAMGFHCRALANPLPGGPPFMLAERRESGAAYTLLSYAHGDVVRGQAGQWHDGLDPWRLTLQGDHWYGRGTADNKGQHSINLLALEQVLAARPGRLGYDMLLLVEMGEETGSPGLHELCR